MLKDGPMKKIFIIVLLFILVGLSLPKYIGGIVDTEHQAAMDKVNDNPAITVNSSTFIQHWFGGQAVTEMTLLLGDEELGGITIIIEEQLSFGPIIYTAEGLQLALSHSQAKINFKELAIDEEISHFINDKVQLSGLLTFSRDIVARLVIDEITKEVDGNKVASAKAEGHFTIENDTRLYGDFTWAGLKATTSDKSFTLGETTFSLDQTLISGDYYQGNAISIGEFEFLLASISSTDDKGKTTLSLSNLLAKAKSTVSKDLMTVKMNYSIDKFESDGQQFEHANLDINFNDLNIKVMQELNNLMTQSTGNDTAEFTSENMAVLSQLTDKLLADEPVVEIQDFSVDTPEGKIESSMKVSADKQLFDTTNIMSIMAAIKANANGKAPERFFAKLGLTPMIEMYIEQGLLMKIDNDLRFKAHLSQGQLEVNGQVLPL